MPTETAYMAVRPDYSTYDDTVDVNHAASPDPAAGKDATPPTSIDSTFSFTLTFPDSSTEDVTEDYPFQVWNDLVDACNAFIQHRLLTEGQHLLEVTYDYPDDVAGDPAAGLSGYLLKRLDVVSEIDEATIRATATV
jgi:hypothetical protein